VVRGRLDHHRRAQPPDTAAEVHRGAAARCARPDARRSDGGELPAGLRRAAAGAPPPPPRRYGDHLDHDRRYERTDEFLSILRGAWSGTPFDFAGGHYDVTGATVGRAPDPAPALFLGGASEAAARVSARHADVHLAWGEPPKAVAEQIQRVRDAAEASGGRAPGFGVRFHVITRDTPEQAWAEADRMLEAMDPQAIAVAQQRFSASVSVGQRRMAALHNGSKEGLEVHPNVWAGFGLLRRHAGTALVGSHEQVAARIEEYRALGIDHFILSGQPHLEEAYRVAEDLLPLVAGER
jgi:alkanesulfonate monooxygenase